ncbi:MAG TPA: CDP-alcohol phosphatidyltransferase family protein [Novosphingobium sp.]|nr:CDP-alcohol phosphatidyltransferase family protein [Novosphingobium sp.]
MGPLTLADRNNHENRVRVPARPKRPRELQDRLNFHLYHPLAWQLARQLAKTPLTPNAVSVIGGLFVVAAAAVYAQPWGVAGAGLGMILHMSWHVIDGADGDLARMTGRTSPIGEMVDGLCDYLSHIVLYLVLGYLLSIALGAAGWWLTVAAGLSHLVQSNHVEVQRRQYQWWVYGTPWLRNTHSNAEAATRKSVFGTLVSAYLGAAAGMTPHALKIDSAVEAAQGDAARLEPIRAAVRAEAPRLLLIQKFLGPNPRAIVLGLSMIAGAASGTGPLWYFLYQSVVLNLLLVASVTMHNAAARRIAAQITA